MADSADDIDIYLANMRQRAAGIADLGYRAVFLQGEIAEWTKREDRLLAWCDGAAEGEKSPFNPPLNAFQIARAINELSIELFSLRKKIREQAGFPPPAASHPIFDHVEELGRLLVAAYRADRLEIPLTKVEAEKLAALASALKLAEGQS